MYSKLKNQVFIESPLRKIILWVETDFNKYQSYCITHSNPGQIFARKIIGRKNYKIINYLTKILYNRQNSSLVVSKNC